LRDAVTAELHARTFEPLRAPVRVSHLVSVCGERGSGRNLEHLNELLALHQTPAPEPVEQSVCVDLGGVRLRWERHTEFVTYTFIQPGSFERPFTDPVLATLPPDWLEGLPGEVITAVSLAIEPCDVPERDHDALVALFGSNPVVGANVVGGAARAWSDFKIHGDGFSWILLRDCGLSDNQTGRLAKRLLEINAYRAMALIGFPLAREAAGPLGAADRRLAQVASRLATGDSSNQDAFEHELLTELTGIAAEIEDVAAHTTYRFDASRAYYLVMEQRLQQLRQTRIEGLQTFSEFLDARLAPAIATCDATQRRQHDLAERASRLTTLLRARVDIALQEQNRRLLESMDRRAQLQVRLQETVEGLSVIAIGYYGVGLVGYALKGLEGSGLPINPELGMGIALPFVIGFTWFGLHRLKRHLTRSV
jgi:uncharacterized membrane-anchored protein